MIELCSYLGGTWQQGTAPRAILCEAATGAPFASASSAGLDLAAALHWSRRTGGASLRALDFTARAELLSAMSAAIHADREAVIELAMQNMGCTRKDAKFDIDGASGTLAWYAGLGRRLGERAGTATWLLDGEQLRISRSRRFIGQHLLTTRPGAAIHINAFNFPAWNMAEKAACALLAGMPVLTKPATATALLAVRIVERWVDADILPAGSLSLLTGSAGDLLDHVQAADCIVFTGSGETARRIRSHQRVLELNVPVNIEADSLNAAILGPDVRPGSDTFHMFTAEVANELLQKAGQKCTAVRRILIPEALLEPAVAALIERLDAAILGDPRDGVATVGPLSTPAQLADVQGAIGQLSARAERIWGDPASAPESGFFVAPQLFMLRGGVDAPFVHEHEIFGPVATVLPYDGSADTAIAIVAQGGGGLVSSLFSDDGDWGGAVLLGLAPWHGRLLWGSAKVHDQSTGHGAVLPALVHGGPGRAGGGEELGGERGLRFYMQRSAIQGDASLLRRLLGDAG